eukprot:79568-Rhodomonas_salina.2
MKAVEGINATGRCLRLPPSLSLLSPSSRAPASTSILAPPPFSQISFLSASHRASSVADRRRCAVGKAVLHIAARNNHTAVIDRLYAPSLSAPLCSAPAPLERRREIHCEVPNLWCSLCVDWRRVD